MPSYWKTFLQRDLMLAATVALAVLNGASFAPLFDSVGYVLFLFTRGSRFIATDMLYYLTSVLMSLLTLMLGGIPAAIYERARGLAQSTPVSVGLWLLTTALLTLPTLLQMIADD